MPKFLYPRALIDECPIPVAHPERSARVDAIALSRPYYWSNRVCALHNLDVMGFPITLRSTKSALCVMCSRQRGRDTRAAKRDVERELRTQALDLLGLSHDTPASRAAARALGAPYYFNGSACPVGHKDATITANNCCRKCVSLLNGQVITTELRGKYSDHLVSLPEDDPKWDQLVKVNALRLLQDSPYFPEPD